MRANFPILARIDRGRLVRLLLFALLVVVGIAGVGLGIAHADEPKSLLDGLSPIRSKGVDCASCLNDDHMGREGDFWRTHVTARFNSRNSFVIYDLGSQQSIVAAWLQGDNNDTYILQISNDGERFEPLWTAPVTNESGLRVRETTSLTGTGRYLKVSASGGDGSFAIGELQVFAQVPSNFPPRLPQIEGVPLERRLRDRTLLFGLALIGALVFAYRGASIFWVLAVMIWPVLTGYRFFEALFEAWPAEMREVSLVRGVIATVAAVAILRETFAPPRFPALRPLIASTLAFCGVAGVLAFYNLGQPQFWNAAKGNWTFVHHLDLRQYYATAKYFKEIGYRGLYEADVAAYAEDRNTSVDSLAATPMRDLADLQMTTVGDRRYQIESIKSRFSPQRWESYKQDTGYFRYVMGTPAWLDTMHDMGGNATPVWISIGYVLFNLFHPNNTAFLITGLIDPLLLIAAFIAIGRTFGWRTSFLCMVIFGANDFIMYGSNWAGATLRHDWLAYIALGICALRSERWVLGGALLGLSSMIRAFPALTVMAGTLPAAWWVFDEWRKTKKLPSWQAFRDAQRPVIRMVIGAAASVTVLFLLSLLVVPISAWGDWWIKVQQLSGDPHANHISLRSLIAGWDDDQGKVLRARLPLYVALVAMFVGAVVFGSRRKRLDQAATLGLCLIPVLFYPANYYIHFVFVLPLLIAECPAKDAKPEPLVSADALIAGVLLGMCAMQYFTVMIGEKGLHFYFGSICLFTGLTLLLVLYLRRDVLVARLAMPLPRAVTEPPIALPAGEAAASASDEAAPLPPAARAGSEKPAADAASGKDDKGGPPGDGSDPERSAAE